MPFGWESMFNVHVWCSYLVPFRCTYIAIALFMLQMGCATPARRSLWKPLNAIKRLHYNNYSRLNLPVTWPPSVSGWSHRCTTSPKACCELLPRNPSDVIHSILPFPASCKAFFAVYYISSISICRFRYLFSSNSLAIAVRALIRHWNGGGWLDTARIKSWSNICSWDSAPDGTRKIFHWRVYLLTI